MAVNTDVTFNEIPTGPLAGQMIKAIHNNSKNNIFPSDSFYAKDWSQAISYLGKKRVNSSNSERSKMEISRVHLPLDHPLEGRNNPQPSKSFIHWREPSRLSGDFYNQEVLQQILADPNHCKNKRQHDVTQTTHFAPPFGKFQPIQSEQQDHMQEVHKQNEALRSYVKANVTKVPRLPLSARFPTEKQKNLRLPSHSATPSWSNRNEFKQQENKQLVDLIRRSKIEKFLSKSGDSDLDAAFQAWFDSVNETDQKAALNFLSFLSRNKPSENFKDFDVKHITQNDKKQSQNVLKMLEKIRPQASPPNPEVLLALHESTRTLDKATESKHHRLFTPASSLEKSKLQTWHQRPVYPHRKRMNHVLSMYSVPNSSPPKDFKIHPEWRF